MVATSNLPGAALSYTRTDTGLHLITMHQSSQRAVDLWMTAMTDIMYTLYLDGDDTYGSVLLDLREPGMMPVGYATMAVGLWAAEYTHPPRIDLAIVYRYGLLHSLASTLSAFSRIEDGVRLFHQGRYTEAIAWLTERNTAI